MLSHLASQHCSIMNLSLNASTCPVPWDETFKPNRSCIILYFNCVYCALSDQKIYVCNIFFMKFSRIKVSSLTKLYFCILNLLWILIVVCGFPFDFFIHYFYRQSHIIWKENNNFYQNFKVILLICRPIDQYGVGCTG